MVGSLQKDVFEHGELMVISVFPSSQSDVDLGSGRDIRTKSDANDKEETIK